MAFIKSLPCVECEDSDIRDIETDEPFYADVIAPDGDPLCAPCAEEDEEWILKHGKVLRE